VKMSGIAEKRLCERTPEALQKDLLVLFGQGPLHAFYVASNGFKIKTPPSALKVSPDR